MKSGLPRVYYEPAAEIRRFSQIKYENVWVKVKELIAPLAHQYNWSSMKNLSMKNLGV